MFEMLYHCTTLHLGSLVKEYCDIIMETDALNALKIFSNAENFICKTSFIFFVLLTFYRYLVIGQTIII